MTDSEIFSNDNSDAEHSDGLLSDTDELSDNYEFTEVPEYGFDNTKTDVNRLVDNARDEIKASRVADTLEREQAGNRAKQALKQLYDDDFDFDNPPDSLDRYERMIALRRLEEAAIYNGKFESEWFEDRELHDLPNVDHAVNVVSIMKTYGELAEHNLARLTSSTVAVPEVREAAADALHDIRSETQQPSHDSLRAALAAWLRPGDDA